MIHFYCDPIYHKHNTCDLPIEDETNFTLDQVLVILSTLYGEAAFKYNGQPTNATESLACYLFHPEACNVDISDLSCDNTSIMHYLAGTKYLSEFTSYLLSKDWKAIRTILLFPIYSDEQQNLEALYIYDIYSNSCFIFSPYQRLSISIFTTCFEGFSRLETKLSTLIFISRCFNHQRSEIISSFSSSLEKNGLNSPFATSLLKGKRMDYIKVSTEETEAVFEKYDNYLVLFVLYHFLFKIIVLGWKDSFVDNSISTMISKEVSLLSFLSDNIFKLDVTKTEFKRRKNFNITKRDLYMHKISCENLYEDYVNQRCKFNFDKINFHMGSDGIDGGSENSSHTIASFRYLMDAMDKFGNFLRRPDVARLYPIAAFTQLNKLFKKMMFEGLLKMNWGFQKAVMINLRVMERQKRLNDAKTLDKNLIQEYIDLPNGQNDIDSDAENDVEADAEFLSSQNNDEIESPDVDVELPDAENINEIDLMEMDILFVKRTMKKVCKEVYSASVENGDEEWIWSLLCDFELEEIEKEVSQRFGNSGHRYKPFYYTHEQHNRELGKFYREICGDNDQVRSCWVDKRLEQCSKFKAVSSHYIIEKKYFLPAKVIKDLCSTCFPYMEENRTEANFLKLVAAEFRSYLIESGCEIFGKPSRHILNYTCFRAIFQEYMRRFNDESVISSSNDPSGGTIMSS